MNKERQQSVDPYRRPVKKRKKPRIFMCVYLLILVALLAMSAYTLRYVHDSLIRYESSQPDNILAAQLEKLREAGAEGNFEDILSLEKMRKEEGVAEEEIAQFKRDFLAGTVTFQEDHSTVDPANKTYDILCNGQKVAVATLNYEGQESLLLIFTLNRWSIEKMEVTGYEFQLTAPACAIIKGNGQVLQGEIADGNVIYDIRSLTPLDVEICDILGNSVPYDPKNLPSFTDYKVTIPSNYTIQGVETVPLEAALLEPIEELKYAKEYCPEVPDTATYILSILSEEPSFKILNNNGEEVEFIIEDRMVTVEGFDAQDSLPIAADIDPLEVAKLWSLFMTQDLSGSNYGYGKLEPFLIKDSYLQGVAWKWATGIDITFTSSHTLKDPPFQVEAVSNYVLYSENCFSCDIRLEKVMVLKRTGAEVNDVINSTFYFVNYDDTDNGKDDPHWVLADYREIS